MTGSGRPWARARRAGGARRPTGGCSGRCRQWSPSRPSSSSTAMLSLPNRWRTSATSPVLSLAWVWIRTPRARASAADLAQQVVGARQHEPRRVGVAQPAVGGAVPARDSGRPPRRAMPGSTRAGRAGSADRGRPSSPCRSSPGSAALGGGRTPRRCGARSPCRGSRWSRRAGARRTPARRSRSARPRRARPRTARSRCAASRAARGRRRAARQGLAGWTWAWTRPGITTQPAQSTMT